MKIAFMGTAIFGAPALMALSSSHHTLCAVYTKPPKPAGRGGGSTKSQIHVLAEELGIPVFCPSSLRSDVELELLRKLELDAIVVAAYGLILTDAVLCIPKHGCINIHPSDLPRWRGAAPLQRSILSGDIKTAICIMQMDQGVDTGDILKKQQLPLDDTITCAELHHKMADLGAELLLTALDEISSGTSNSQCQGDEGATYADKLIATDEVLDFNRPARLANCQVRALSPRPGAYFKYKNEIIKVITATYENMEQRHRPGTVVDDALSIACTDGVLRPTLLQRQGRKMIYTEAFLRGFPITKDTILDGNL